MEEYNNLSNFELLLNKNTIKPSPLYSTNQSVNNSTIKPQDVLNSVYSQIKTMQLADRRPSKNIGKHFKEKSGFMTVSKLPIYNQIPKPTNAFETECVSDTQLINIIEDAEALVNTHKGMTQEFNTDFIHTDTINKDTVSIKHNITERENMFETQEFETTFTQTNVDDTISFLHDRFERDENKLENKYDGDSNIYFKNVDSLKEICNKVVRDKSLNNILKEKYSRPIDTNNKGTDITTDYKSVTDKSDTEFSFNTKEDMTVTENILLVSTESLNNLMDIEEERSPSPVLNIKSNTVKARTHSPFVVSLESFEKFERIAIPLIDNDIETCKHLINSQIIGEELCLDTVADNNDNGELSPILKKSYEFNDSKELIERIKSIAAKLDLREKRSESLKDEILFSSDEENDFIYKEFQDLPLTAALETSFYDHSNVLEENMYVGFHTASNKSIQINSDSFKKAQFILDEVKFRSDLSLSKLVEICDEKSFNQSNADVQDKLNSKTITEESICIEQPKDIKGLFDRHCDDIVMKTSIKQDFIGFKTANNKNIDLSDKAIEIGKKMLMEINDKIKQTNPDYIKEEANTRNNIDKNISDLDNIDDEIIQEFENIEMSLEDKNNKCDEDNEKLISMGFKTASNKCIKISKAAKNKIRDVFQDIELGDVHLMNDPLQKSPKLNSKETESKNLKETFGGFKTANNKNIKISAQALAKTRNLFDDDKDIAKSDHSKVKRDQINYNDYHDHPSTSKSHSVDFKTTYREDNKETEMAEFKLNKFFNDIDKDRDKKVTVNVEKPKNILKLFKSPSSRSMKIFKNLEQNEELKRKDEILKTNDKLLVSSKTTLEDFKSYKANNSNSKPNVLNNVESHNPIFKGFRTASKKPVKVSAQAMERSKNIFKDIDDNIESDSDFKGFNKRAKTVTNEVMDDVKMVLGTEEENVNKKLPNVNGKANSLFKTASNKDVTVSKSALAKCKKLFEDIDDSVDNVKEKETIGFQTASNKKVKVSDEALKRTKEVFDDIDITDTKLTFKGFQTCRNEKIGVSKVALEKAKAILNDDKISGFDFKGFKTASDKKVEITEEAIEKTKILFNIEADIEPKFLGFQTCRNEKVNVTKQALQKSIALFNDVPEKFKGFYTASKKTVHISEEALAKSKEIFESIDKNKINITEDKNVESEADLKQSKKSLVSKHVIHKDAIADTSLINTEILNEFESELDETPRRNKRSGSPILSCPRAKKKRFQTPYKENKVEDVPKPVVVTKTTEIKFNDDYKKDKKYKLSDLEKQSTIDPYIASFNLDNILDFEFKIERNNITNSKMTIPQLKDLFTNAVNKNLIPEGWLDIHIKLIIWKLLSYEVKYKYICTTKDIVDQLKYRYDKELYNTERSVLRKIYEKDDVASKTMVLCVAGIIKNGVSPTNNEIELLLTDGWYFIKASLDKMLSKLVCDNKIVIGCKIVTCGAELVNCEGISPWEDTSSVRLKIFGNSTRPARWDTKLGYTSSTILSQLSSVKVDGGKICRLRVYIARVYPMLYVEKFQDGSTVTRSERLEHLHQIKYESERELMMERIYEEVQREFEHESQDSEFSDSVKRNYYESGSQIAQVMKHSKDPMEFRAQLTSSQVQLLQNYTSKHQEKIYQAIQSRVQDKLVTRNVVTLARVRIASVSDEGVVTKGMLSIWKPNEAVLDIFKEGCWVEIMNSVPTGIRFSEIQITAGRQSLFRAAKHKIEESRHLSALKRTCYQISDVTLNPTMITDYNEIDTVGIVFLIDPSNKEFESSRNFQNVYLADADKNIICLNFWSGIKKFGFENILDTGQIVLCANLQKRAGNTRKNIPQFRVTEFSCFTKTPKNAHAREIIDELNKKLNGLDRRKFCDDCIAIKNNYAAIRSLNDTENESPYRFSKMDFSLARNKMFIDSPLGVKHNKNQDANLNLTGLDFESTFKQDTQELSPNTMLRKQKVNEKIAKLKMYGEPPPLSPITIIDRSANAKRSYKSPLLSTPTLPKNTFENKIDREKSPVFSVKRSYVSVPVKLNFVNESNNDVDHFAEEFDGSPPLSLE